MISANNLFVFIIKNRLNNTKMTGIFIILFMNILFQINAYIIIYFKTIWYNKSFTGCKCWTKLLLYNIKGENNEKYFYNFNNIS